MKWFRVSMILALVVCCWIVHWVITDGPESRKRVARTFIFIAGFLWAAVVRVVCWIRGVA